MFLPASPNQKALLLRSFYYSFLGLEPESHTYTCAVRLKETLKLLLIVFSPLHQEYVTTGQNQSS